MDTRETDNGITALIRQAQAGSVEAFEELVRLHDRQILQLICGIVGNMHDAHDVYQETFIRAYQKLASFRFESQLSTWLGRIAINLSLNWCKRQRRKNWFSLDRWGEASFNGAEQSDGPQGGSEERLLRKELQEQLQKGLQRLPEQQRTAFVLKHQQGYKIREIAELMDCAEGTVKNHLFRATQKLKKIMRPYYEMTE